MNRQEKRKLAAIKRKPASNPQLQYHIGSKSKKSAPISAVGSAITDTSRRPK